MALLSRPLSVTFLMATVFVPWAAFSEDNLKLAVGAPCNFHRGLGHAGCGRSLKGAKLVPAKSVDEALAMTRAGSAQASALTHDASLVSLELVPSHSRKYRAFLSRSSRRIRRRQMTLRVSSPG
jgi:hypothetical protein